MAAKRTPPEFYYECDGCESFTHTEPTRKTAAQMARHEGWRIGKVHLCPNCVAGKSGHGVGFKPRD